MIVYKKTDGQYIEWQRVTTIGTTSDKEWQRVTTNDSEWQQMTRSDNEWSFWLIFHWTGLSIETCEDSVFGMSIKMSIPVPNFSTESSWIGVLHCNLSSKQWQQASLWNEKLAPQQSLYCNRSFSRLGIHSDDRPKSLPSNFSEYFFAYKLSYENNSQSLLKVIQET